MGKFSYKGHKKDRFYYYNGPGLQPGSGSAIATTGATGASIIWDPIGSNDHGGNNYYVRGSTSWVEATQREAKSQGKSVEAIQQQIRGAVSMGTSSLKPERSGPIDTRSFGSVVGTKNLSNLAFLHAMFNSGQFSNLPKKYQDELLALWEKSGGSSWPGNTEGAQKEYTEHAKTAGVQSRVKRALRKNLRRRRKKKRKGTSTPLPQLKTKDVSPDLYSNEEQSFLFDHFEVFEAKATPIKYNNFVPVRGGSPYEFFSKATTAREVHNFNNATPEELAGLVPYIKIWKLLQPKKDGPEEALELEFNHFVDEKNLAEITKSRGNRGAGVGIQSFEILTTGMTPATVDKYFETKLIIYFQDINSFIKPQHNGVSFLDLIYKTQTHIIKEECKAVSVWNEKYYRMKIQVGWSGSKNSSLSSQAERSRYNYYLSQTSHDIDFRNDGTIVLTLNMKGTVDFLYQAPDSDILLMDSNHHITELLNNISGSKCREESLLAAKAKTTEENLAAIHRLRNGIISVLKRERYSQYNAFFTKLEDLELIHHVDVPPEDVIKWKMSGLDPLNWSEDHDNVAMDEIMQLLGGRAIDKKTGKMKTGLKWNSYSEEAKKRYKTWLTHVKGEKPKDWAEALKKWDDLGLPRESSMNKGSRWEFGRGKLEILGRNKKYKGESNNKRYAFIYLGSIIEVALSVLTNENNVHKIDELRHILGTIEIDDIFTGEVRVVSMADIPVSFRLFKNWFFKNAKEDPRTSWPLGTFLSGNGGLIETLFKPIVNSVSKYKRKTVVGYPILYFTPMQIALNTDGACPFTGTKTIKAFNKEDYIDGTGMFRPTYNSVGKKIGTYVFIHAVNLRPGGGLFPCDDCKTTKDRKAKDKIRGVEHLSIGSSVGMVKTITFSKMENAYIEAAKINKEGRAGLGGVTQIYNANVEMYGNNFFRPGSAIYINTSSLSAEFGNTENDQALSHKLGIGGYYNINVVESSLTPTGYITSLQCSYIGSGLPSPIRKKATTTALADLHARQAKFKKLIRAIDQSEAPKKPKGPAPIKTEEVEVEVKKYEFAGPNADRHVDASEEYGGNVKMKWAAEMDYREGIEETRALFESSPYQAPYEWQSEIEQRWLEETFPSAPPPALAEQGAHSYQSLDEQLDNDENFNRWLVERNKEKKSRTNVGDFYVRGDDDSEEVG